MPETQQRVKLNLSKLLQTLKLIYLKPHRSSTCRWLATLHINGGRNQELYCPRNIISSGRKPLWWESSRAWHSQAGFNTFLLILRDGTARLDWTTWSILLVQTVTSRVNTSQWQSEYSCGFKKNPFKMDLIKEQRANKYNLTFEF